MVKKEFVIPGRRRVPLTYACQFICKMNEKRLQELIPQNVALAPLFSRSAAGAAKVYGNKKRRAKSFEANNMVSSVGNEVLDELQYELPFPPL